MTSPFRQQLSAQKLEADLRIWALVNRVTVVVIGLMEVAAALLDDVSIHSNNVLNYKGILSQQ